MHVLVDSYRISDFTLLALYYFELRSKLQDLNLSRYLLAIRAYDKCLGRDYENDKNFQSRLRSQGVFTSREQEGCQRRRVSRPLDS